MYALFFQKLSVVFVTDDFKNGFFFFVNTLKNCFCDACLMLMLLCFNNIYFFLISKASVVRSLNIFLRFLKLQVIGLVLRFISLIKLVLKLPCR